MGDDQHGLVPDEPGKRGLNQRLVLHVQGRRGLVQKDDGRVFQKCPGDGNALALAAGKLAAVFSDAGVPALRQLFGKFVHVGQPRGRQDFLVGGVFVADADVFQDGVVKQGDILKDDGIQRKQRFRVDPGHIHAAHGDASPAGIPEPGGQAGYGGLAAA